MERATRIAAPAEAVFEFLADPTRWVEYDPTLVEVTPTDRLVVGATGIVRNRRMGMTAKGTWTTTELEPAARVRQVLRGIGYELTESVRLTAVDGGTDMHVVNTLLPTSLGRPRVRRDVARNPGARPSGPVPAPQGVAGARACGRLSNRAIAVASASRPAQRSGGPSISRNATPADARIA